MLHKSWKSIRQQEEDDKEERRKQKIVPHTGTVVPQCGNIYILRTTDSNWEREVTKVMTKYQHRAGVFCLFCHGHPLRVL